LSAAPSGQEGAQSSRGYGVATMQAQAQQAAEHPWAEGLFRAGLVAKAVLYSMIGALALGVALGVGGRTTDATGALATLAGAPVGMAVLTALAIGLVGYAAWRAAQAALDLDGDGDDAAGVVSRVGAAGSALVHVGLAVVAVRLLADGGSSGSGVRGSSRQEQQTTAGVLDWPGGRALVIVAALVVIGVGAYNLWQGLTRDFMERVRVAGSRRALVERLGVAGFVARGAVFGLAGAFLMKAAIEFDPSEAVGIDGALARLADRPFGPFLLGAAAAGLVAYALLCLAWARWREV
jgi:hypothetical protein